MAGHFYDRYGNPRYEGGLRDARKNNYYGSVTTVLGDTWANPGLDIWKSGQLILAACTLSRREGEDDRSFVSRVKEDSSQQAKSAAEFGTRLHDAIEHYGTGKAVDSDLQPYLDYYAEWHNENVAEIIARETVLCDHTMGIAAKVDMIFRDKFGDIVICDHKTQGIKEGNKGEARQGHVEQVAFAARTYQKVNGLSETPRCMNLIINSIKPEPVQPHPWDADDVDLGYKRFVSLAWVWCSSKGKAGFWPAGKWSVCDVIN